MTVAVSPHLLGSFLELAKDRDVEATVLGTFTDTGKFRVTYGERTVAYLDMDFLHNGLPRMRLRADWHRREHEEPDFGEPHDLNRILEEMLARLNICSKESKLRQYDHEVKGLSVIKPLCGAQHDVPSDATISLLEYGSREGLILSEGLNPHYSEVDTYDMVASVIDEAVRRVIAVGGSLPSRDNPFYALDNFCWNMSRLEDDDGGFKLSQLVRANRALSDYCLAFGVPCVSGKDSMKNVWKIKRAPDGGERESLVSIPPTLLFSVRSKIADVEDAVTMDVKSPGDLVYVVGCTYDESGGSEYYQHMGETISGTAFVGNKVPKVRADSAKEIYVRVSKATKERIVRSIHTPTVGGLGVALALSAIAGGHGMEVELRDVPRLGVDRDDLLLFSESNSRFVVTVGEQKKEEFESLMRGIPSSSVGKVSEGGGFRVRGLKGELVIDSDIDLLRRSWKGRLSVM
jgi:phosphoribosylformylglycinamidine synthase